MIELYAIEQSPSSTYDIIFGEPWPLDRDGDPIIFKEMIAYGSEGYWCHNLVGCGCDITSNYGSTHVFVDEDDIIKISKSWIAWYDRYNAMTGFHPFKL